MIRLDTTQVIAVAELIDVPLQMLPTDAVELAEHPTLQEAQKPSIVFVWIVPSTYHFACLMTAWGSTRAIPR